VPIPAKTSLRGIGGTTWDLGLGSALPTGGVVALVGEHGRHDDGRRCPDSERPQSELTLRSEGPKGIPLIRGRPDDGAVWAGRLLRSRRGDGFGHPRILRLEFDVVYPVLGHRTGFARGSDGTGMQLRHLDRVGEKAISPVAFRADVILSRRKVRFDRLSIRKMGPREGFWSFFSIRTDVHMRSFPLPDPMATFVSTQELILIEAEIPA
jgi:hypothetical protein